MVLNVNEVNRERRREICVLKSRGMAHSNFICEFALSDRGLRITEQVAAHRPLAAQG
jgi:KaiC/GvpD/RAD55 family RecA-like ATPase